ncbi:hypothetical protein SY88_12145 [Clostridiales bacterium PH28_bin88]|nr:hypothetical protein SY88_12145 [Clostridiales bacterium PH28_bin88]
MKTEFFKPGTLEEALGLLDQFKENAVIVNGGTDIVEKIVSHEVEPEAIVYIRDIPECRGIEQNDGTLSIGGAVTYREIQESPLCTRIAGLIQAVSEIGSPPIRNVATPAGNIANAAPAADCNIMLLALEAEVVLACTGGERVVALQDIWLNPQETTIRKNELIRAIRIAIPSKDTSTAYVKMTRRKAQDISRVSVGVSLTLTGTFCQEIRIALGAVNKVPVRAYSLEKMMAGKEVETGLAEIRSVFPAEATPRKSYKKLVTNAVIERAIRKAYETIMAGGECIG